MPGRGCGLIALGQGDFEVAYQQTGMISPPGLLAPQVPHTLRVLMDLVEAAVRTGRDAEAAAHVAVMQDANLAALSSRLSLVVGLRPRLRHPTTRRSNRPGSAGAP